MKNEKVYVYIGRFQIAHNGHEETIKHALQKADKLIIVVGSSELARDPKNPFTFEERKQVLEEICQRNANELWANGKHVTFDIVPANDYVYNNTRWLTEIQNKVLNITESNDITLTGYDKDESTYYLNFFPSWKNDFIKPVVNINGTVSSTTYREYFFGNNTIGDDLPNETKEFLTKFAKCKTEIYNNLVKEKEFIDNYQSKMIRELPYTNIPFLTGDSLVISAGHILLVKRRSYPGKGLYALPGGFFDAFKDQDQIETALRELKEETKIDVPMKVLKGNIRKVDEFGDMNRSLRWRIITKCVYIQLPDNKLPKVKGSDDAEEAFWMPLADIAKNRDMMFEDHYSIISQMVGI